ncbi:MAG: DNA repair protein RecO [bacterium]|nr:DNA repair protein RecO [bacterium]
MKHESANGIILRRINYGEADRIITFLTAEFGKIRAIAKGVRKQKSKMAGGIELFSVSELQFIKGKGDIDTLMSTRLIKHYGNVVKDLERTQLAYDFLKIIDKTVEDTAGNEYFMVLHESIAALDNVNLPITLSEMSFDMRVLQLLGQVPNFGVDSLGNPLDELAQYEFDFESVSFVASPSGQFNKNHLKVLRLMAHNSPQSMASVQGIGRLVDELKPMVRNLFSYYAPQ